MLKALGVAAAIATIIGAVYTVVIYYDGLRSDTHTRSEPGGADQFNVWVETPGEHNLDDLDRGSDTPSSELETGGSSLQRVDSESARRMAPVLVPDRRTVQMSGNATFLIGDLITDVDKSPPFHIDLRVLGESIRVSNVMRLESIPTDLFASRRVTLLIEGSKLINANHAEPIPVWHPQDERVLFYLNGNGTLHRSIVFRHRRTPYLRIKNLNVEGLGTVDTTIISIDIDVSDATKGSFDWRADINLVQEIERPAVYHASGGITSVFECTGSCTLSPRLSMKLEPVSRGEGSLSGWVEFPRGRQSVGGSGPIEGSVIDGVTSWSRLEVVAQT